MPLKFFQKSRRDVPSPYPLLPWICLSFIQGVGSLISLVLWPVVFAHLGTGSLEKAFATEENRIDPDLAHAKWYFKVFQIAAIFTFIIVIIMNVLRFYRRLHPAFAAVCSGIALLLWITGIAGVGAFTFGAGLSGPCGNDASCMIYKAGFFSGHIAGYSYILELVLDGYAWGRMDEANRSTRGSQKLSGNDAYEIPYASLSAKKFRSSNPKSAFHEEAYEPSRPLRTSAA